MTTTNVGSIYSYIIKDGAHGYDLHGSNPADSVYVKEVRLHEKYIIELNCKIFINSDNSFS